MNDSPVDPQTVGMNATRLNEALAYALPPHSPDHRSHLEVARESYRKAREMDPD